VGTVFNLISRQEQSKELYTLASWYTFGPETRHGRLPLVFLASLRNEEILRVFLAHAVNDGASFHNSRSRLTSPVLTG
jgi:hypothetical protein